jgi:hypothetical protein
MSTIIDGSASVTINSGAVLGITSGTAVASTSGVSIDFTSIPSWVKRITVMFSGVSTNGTSPLQVQLGTSGGVDATSYIGACRNRATETFYTSAFLVNRGYTASSTASGHIVLTLVSGNLWSGSGVTASSATDAPCFFAGTKTTS